MKYPLTLRQFLLTFSWATLVCLCLTGYVWAETGQIVYSSFQSGSWEIWTTGSRGGETVQLTKTPEDLRAPAWSPDHKQLAFVSNTGQLYILDLASGKTLQPEPLPGKCDQPVWRTLPQGQALTFVSYTYRDGEDSDLFELVPTDQSTQRPKAIVNREQMEGHPKWSPDGDRLVYTLFHRDAYNTVIEDLWLWDAVAQNHRLLLQTGAQNFQADWSPDGKSLVFASNLSGDYEIWLLGFRPARLLRLTKQPGYDGDPCWSPDGSQIAFVSTRSGQKQIWIMDKDGDNLRQLTTGQAPSQDPDW